MESEKIGFEYKYLAIELNHYLDSKTRPYHFQITEFLAFCNKHSKFCNFPAENYQELNLQQKNEIKNYIMLILEYYSELYNTKLNIDKKNGIISIQSPSKNLEKDMKCGINNLRINKEQNISTFFQKNIMEYLTTYKLQSEPKKSTFFDCLSLLNQYIDKKIKRSNTVVIKITERINDIYTYLSREEQKEFGLFISKTYSQTIQQRLTFYKQLRDYIISYINKTKMKAFVTEKEFIKQLLLPSVFWISPFPSEPFSRDKSFLPFIEIKLNMLPVAMLDLFLQKFHLDIIKAIICKNKPNIDSVELYEEYLAPNTIRVYYFLKYKDTFSKIRNQFVFKSEEEYTMQVSIPVSMGFYEKFPSFSEEIRSLILENITEFYRYRPCGKKKLDSDTSFLPDMSVKKIVSARISPMILTESKLYFIDGVTLYIGYWNKSNDSGCIKVSAPSSLCDSYDILL